MRQPRAHAKPAAAQRAAAAVLNARCSNWLPPLPLLPGAHGARAGGRHAADPGHGKGSAAVAWGSQQWLAAVAAAVGRCHGRAHAAQQQQAHPPHARRPPGCALRLAAVQAQIKALLTGLMLRTPDRVRAQLSEALSLISASDFPAAWPQLLPELVERLSGAGWGWVGGGGGGVGGMAVGGGGGGQLRAHACLAAAVACAHRTLHTSCGLAGRCALRPWRLHRRWRRPGCDIRRVRDRQQHLQAISQPVQQQRARGRAGGDAGAGSAQRAPRTAQQQPRGQRPAPAPCSPPPRQPTPARSPRAAAPPCAPVCVRCRMRLRRSRCRR